MESRMENLENLSLADLRAYAKKLGMKGVSTLQKKRTRTAFVTRAAKTHHVRGTCFH